MNFIYNHEFFNVLSRVKYIKFEIERVKDECNLLHYKIYVCHHCSKLREYEVMVHKLDKTNSTKLN